MCPVCICPFDNGEVGPRVVANWGYNVDTGALARHALASLVGPYDGYTSPDVHLREAPTRRFP